MEQAEQIKRQADILLAALPVDDTLATAQKRVALHAIIEMDMTDVLWQVNVYAPARAMAETMQDLMVSKGFTEQDIKEDATTFADELVSTLQDNGY